MKTNCLYNTHEVLSKEVRGFAYPEEEDGLLDLSIGSDYDVYGVRINDLGTFYLLVTDSSDLPWWMPAALFKELAASVPDSWVTRQSEGYGSESISASPAYFGHEEDIEDGTDDGYAAFALMKSGKNK